MTTEKFIEFLKENGFVIKDWVQDDLYFCQLKWSENINDGLEFGTQRDIYPDEILTDEQLIDKGCQYIIERLCFEGLWKLKEEQEVRKKEMEEYNKKQQVKK